MPLVTENRLMSLFDVPVTLPQTAIESGVALAIATVQLPSNAKIDLRWLQMYVIGTDAVAPFITNSAYPGGGVAAILLILNWTPTTSPWLQSVSTVIPLAQAQAPSPSTLPQLAQFNTAQPLDITAAGSYTFVVLNNTTNATLDISISGTLTLDLDPSS
jgi:hypothetical protein